MTQNSLRLRLLIAWAVFIFLTLQVAGIGLRFLFERHITHRTEAELTADLRQLLRGMDMTKSGAITILRAPTDPQFDIEFGGRYWQIEENAMVILRSRSLKDATLKTPANLRPDGSAQTHWLAGPKNQRLFAITRHHMFATLDASAPHALVVTTAVDAAEITDDTNKFSSDLFSSLAGLAALLMLGAWAHVTIGLRPLEALRSKVANVREGKARSIDGNYPDEVMPLVAETNALLDAQQNALQAARQRAGDLAHGLNTPLAIMAAKSRELRRKGDDSVAAEIETQVESMRRHVERELARARARGASIGGNLATNIVPLTHDLVAAISSLPRDIPLEWNEKMPDTLALSVDADDFNNIAGNLLENAHKWAASQVRVSALKTSSGVEFTVEDDGPGVPETHYDRVLLRGERLDTSVRGTGLGLAIVNDLAELYRGNLELSPSQLGGLKVTVTLPG